MHKEKSWASRWKHFMRYPIHIHKQTYFNCSSTSSV